MRSLRAATTAVAVLLAALAGVSCSRQVSVAEEPVAPPAGADNAASPEAKTMRPTAVAGPPKEFYAADPARLAQQVRRYLEAAEVPDLTGRTVAVMVPHAGYVFSAAVAAYSYKVLQGRGISTVVLLGNSHTTYFTGAAVSPDDAWDCPLGPVAVDRDLARDLLASGPSFVESREVHAAEHSLEVQIPFIRTVLPEAKILPILLSDATEEQLRKIAAAVARILARPDTVLVTSTDLAHYPEYRAAKRSDLAILEAIATLDPARIAKRDRELLGERIPDLRCTVCGMEAVLCTVMVAQQLGVTDVRRLHYANSGDTGGDHSACVGYGALAFVAPRTQAARPSADPDTVPLSEAEKERLLRVARQSIEANLGVGPRPDLDPGNSAALAQPTACFVTLKQKGRLRGCIGELEPSSPLIEAVASRAVAAAESDPRFMPVAADELPSIEIDISAMSPLRRVAAADEIVVGKHGVVVKQAGHSGVFLPQVAPEQGWDRDTMLSILCTEKAGLPADAWKTGAGLWVFTANVFSEEEFGLAPPESLKR
jgi:AmmeMemoRadiSam system protein B/AmmeMemoRadiSam system protein A